MRGRDAAGKGGTIQRFMERLNPRGARVVALEKPTEREAGQWYFQRYVAHLPARGEIVFFDRSWYNRAGVERVMGFCSEDEYRLFLEQTPLFERLLTDDGIMLVKFWFSVSRAEQRTRFAIRQVDPVRRWKLSPMDLESLDRWDDYTKAKVEMFRATDTPQAPWTVVKNNDKRRGRLEAMRSLLDRCDYPAKDHGALGKPDPLIVGAADTLLEAGEEPAVLSPTPSRVPATVRAATRRTHSGARSPDPGAAPPSTAPPQRSSPGGVTAGQRHGLGRSGPGDVTAPAVVRPWCSWHRGFTAPPAHGREPPGAVPAPPAHRPGGVAASTGVRVARARH